MDDIHERLLTVAVEAVSIHGGKDQEEREAAIQQFKAGTKVAAQLSIGVSVPAGH